MIIAILDRQEMSSTRFGIGLMTAFDLSFCESALFGTRIPLNLEASQTRFGSTLCSRRPKYLQLQFK